ncbi:hypothetical protein QCE47_05125 [Caballeronia sp. LZ025]|uniref:hypothetical protein n=1 Tax=Caballeronia TaxID=1827195 RepID=UPI001FD028D7|nr:MULTISPECIES: hypothetical protein [Caballeronia]MDR5731729.1 hypothetical protein [Caballeronia sp. LZ025]
MTEGAPNDCIAAHVGRSARVLDVHEAVEQIVNRFDLFVLRRCRILGDAQCRSISFDKSPAKRRAQRLARVQRTAGADFSRSMPALRDGFS